MVKLTNEQALLVEELRKLNKPVTRQEIITLGAKVGTNGVALTQRIHTICKAGRGLYDLSLLGEVETFKPPVQLSEKEREEKLVLKFGAMRVMSRATAQGKTRALIISGPGGLGKSYEVLDEIKHIQPNFDEVKQKIGGMVRPTGLYKSFYEYSTPGSLLVFDDADNIFYDDICLNLLKAACDTSKKRVLSWRAETRMEDTLGDTLPPYFEFHGNVIFITNEDFREKITSGSRLAPHLEALMSRSHYLDLELKSREDRLCRIRQVMNSALASGNTRALGIEKASDVNEIYEYMKNEVTDLEDLNLRQVIKLAQLKGIAKEWQKLAKSMK